MYDKYKNIVYIILIWKCSCCSIKMNFVYWVDGNVITLNSEGFYAF